MGTVSQQIKHGRRSLAERNLYTELQIQKINYLIALYLEYF